MGIMKKTGVALVLTLGLLGHSLPAKAETDDEKAERLLEAIEAQAKQDNAESDKKGAALQAAIDKKLQAIAKEAPGPRSKAALRKALLAWMAYQRAMSSAVETSYSEAGGHGGDQAATHCNLMTEEDFLKALNQFFSE